MNQEEYSQEDLRQVSNILIEAFEQKIEHMWIMTGDYEQANRIITQSIKPNQLLVERDNNNKIVGVATIQTKEKTKAIDIPKDLFISEFGLIKGLFRHISYKVYKFAQIELTDTMLHLDLLAVDSSCRGQGIGTRLLDQVEQAGRANQKSYLELEVVGGNEAAKRLYNRFGFKDIRREDMNILYKLFTKKAGFTHMYILKKLI